MDLKTLYEMQEELDNTIFKKLFGDWSDMATPDMFIVQRLLALQVEVSELANALKRDGFKYWTTKPAEPRDRLLDEYVDILHFFLSVGLSLGFTHEDVEEAYKKKNAVNFKRQEEGY